MTQSHEPMDVHYHVERDPKGGTWSTPVPIINPDWSDLDKLRWYAGCLKAATGITVNIVTDVRTDLVTGRTFPGEYGYGVGTHSGGAYSYDKMWAWFNGLRLGHALATKDNAA
ncbi:hypothetical protein [Kocuria rosea]|uniref:hypothetical protein n=1 Tax=Kocuria rosea TaxID=1275 RepID=UPI003D3318FB